MFGPYQQQLDPLHDSVFWSSIFSTAFAALPVLVLFWLLVPRRWLAPKAAAAGALTAIVIAVLVYRMPPIMTGMAFLYGVGFGLLPVGWTIFSAMLLYNITVETGQFSVIRRSVAGLSGDARIQAILIGFAFGAFLEGAAGGGTPVAICGAIMVGLGFHPFLAAVLCLIANTSPVAYGGLGTPLLTLTSVTNLDTFTLSKMAGRQLPLLSMLVPLWMVRCMCNWKRTLAIWPALAVAGGSFAVFQFTFAHIQALYPMTDIGGGIFSLVVTAVFLKFFWKPREEWHFPPPPNPPAALGDGVKEEEAKKLAGAHAAEAAALTAAPTSTGPEPPLTWKSVSVAWLPYGLMSVLLLLTGIVRQMEGGVKEGPGPVAIGPLHTNYGVVVPTLHQQVSRDATLHPVRMEQAAVLPLAGSNLLETAIQFQVAQRIYPRPEGALFNFPWLTSPGTGVFLAAVLSMLLFRMNRRQVVNVFRRTCWQMKIPIPTIACMLGLSYVTRYAGMDATLGVAFAGTGVLYPFFAAILGWLGVFLTGTDAGSNALFGSLQKITATQIYHQGVFSHTHLSLTQAQTLICVANSTGGVMGKMIDAQSICVATAATHQVGKEADIFKGVIWHSIILAALVGLIVLLQAYVAPFTYMVPAP
jgi:lactate permease